MNIIFLDVDGVLNSMAYFKLNKKTKESLFNDISDFHLQKLAEIYHECNAHIVLSSTWRELDDEYNEFVNNQSEIKENVKEIDISKTNIAEFKIPKNVLPNKSVLNKTTPNKKVLVF